MKNWIGCGNQNIEVFFFIQAFQNRFHQINSESEGRDKRQTAASVQQLEFGEAEFYQNIEIDGQYIIKRHSIFLSETGGNALPIGYDGSDCDAQTGNQSHTAKVLSGYATDLKNMFQVITN